MDHRATLETMLASMTPEEIFPRSLYEDAVRTQEFWNAHYEEFLAEYREQYVAVKDGQVVATRPDLISLIKSLQEFGLCPSDVAIQFITADPGLLIL